MTVITALLAMCISLGALADPPELLLSLNVNYGSAYRNGAWTPIDVLAINQGPAVTGDLAVKVYDYNGLQSPVHKMPVELPTNSVKRFRFTCRLKNVDHVEVEVQNGSRALGNSALRMPLPPIRPNDLLGLIIDEKPEDFGFLSDLYEGENAPRFFREALVTDQLPMLSENPRCYDAFDVIVLGDTDPARFGDAQQAALRRFVADGGTLVLMTGAQGNAYRGSWLEDLAQVSIGEAEYLRADDFAKVALGEEKAKGVVAEASTSMARLSPRGEGVKRLGTEKTLATLTTLGAGRIIVFANDQKTHALDACAGYRDVWAVAAARRADAVAPRWVSAASAFNGIVPQLAGVTLLPRSSVLSYLGLYAFVAIVLNWGFWSFRKRREMAWVCLVFLSFGFTGYAMVYGTAGRAQQSQLFQIDFVQPTAGGAGARVDSLVGIVSSGTARYAPELPLPQSLAVDMTAEMGYNQNDPYGSRRSRGAAVPCAFIEGETPRLEDVRIGASDSRILHVSSEAELPGGIEGTLVITDSAIKGVFKNRTGQTLANPYLLMDGISNPLTKSEDDTWTLDTSRGSITGDQRRGMGGQMVNPFGLNRGRPDMAKGLQTYASSIASRAFSTDEDQYLYSVAPMAPVAGESPFPPLFLARIEGATRPAVQAEGKIQFKEGAGFLVATLQVDDQRTEFAGERIVPLRVGNMRSNACWTGEWRETTDRQAREMIWNESSEEVYSGNPAYVRVQRESMRSAPVKRCWVDVYWPKEHGDLVVTVDGSTLSGTELEEESLATFKLRHQRVEMPETFLSKKVRGGSTGFELSYTPQIGITTRNTNRRGNAAASFTVECHVSYEPSARAQKEAIAWQ